MTATLTAPTPLAPALGGAVDAAAAAFAWQPAEGAASYRLQVADAPGFASPILDLDAGLVTEVTLTDALRPTPEARFWRVGAVDASGETAWSRPRPFTLPEPEALVTVRAEAETAAEAEADASRAEARLAASLARTLPSVPDLPPPPALPPLPTGPTVSGEPSATDWRRVPGVAEHPPEASGAAASGARTLGAPRALGPLGGAIVDGAATVFRWTSVPGADGYEVEIGPDLSGPTLRVGAGTTTEMALGGALPTAGDRLFWRVRAQEASGASGPWSKYGRFYAGTDLQAAAYHDRQQAERAYARRLQEHEALQAEADLAPVAEHERPDAVSSMASIVLMLTMLVLGSAMILLAAIGGMITP